VNRWRGVFDHLNKHLDGRDVALVTDEDAVAWKDKLIGGGASGRTINEIWLTAASRIFSWVKSQKKITSNPFEGLKVAVAKAGPTKTEFRDEDVEIILKAALVPGSPRVSPYLRAAIRWVPWLCAYTGSRAGEMAQLRKEDVEQHKDGFWMVHIRGEAGTVKGSVDRTVVLHEHLVEQGFTDFVQKADSGPLFYETKSKRTKVEDPLNPVRPPYVIVRQKVADWVRNLGVTDKGVSPNHAWRHTFKRRAARAKIEQRLRDAFCGHSAGHVGAIYELPTVEDLAEAIKTFPRYPVDTP
jgi:integrase